MSRTRVLALLLAVSTAACGPTVSLEIGVRERPVDAEFEKPAVAAPPAAPTPEPAMARTTAPGFVAAAVRLEPPRVIVPAPSSVKCKAAHGQEAPDVLAPPVLTGPPAAGLYRFRRTGSVEFGGSIFPMAPEITRVITDVEEIRNPTGQRTQYRYKQVEEEIGLKTTTTYRIDQPVIGPDGVVVVPGGMFIEQIVTEALLVTTAPELAKGVATGQWPFGKETFTPTPAVQIADLPFADQAGLPPKVSGGVDPLNGTAMTVRYRTIGHSRVDACGTVFDGWEVEVLPESRFVNAGIRGFTFEGRFSVAPQLGGLIVSDQIHQVGDELSLDYHVRTAAVINHTVPEKP